MSAYRTPPAAAPERPVSWRHRLAHFFGLHACTCEVVIAEDGDRVLVYVTCDTCGERTILASRRYWDDVFVSGLRAHNHIRRGIGAGDRAFASGAVASTLASLDDMKARHAELTAACRRLDRVLGDRIAAGR